MANLHLIAKGGLVVLVIASIAILIERLTNGSQTSEILETGIEELEVISTPLPVVIDVVVKNFEKCLTEHSGSSYFLINQVKNTSCHVPPGHCMYRKIISFSELMKSFHIKLRLIEPSLLFCLLPSARKFNLLTRGFSNVKVKGSRNVMTFGILPSEAEVLDKTHVRLELIYAGYRILRFPNWIKSGIITDDKSDGDVQTVHFFIMHQDTVMHLITFYPRTTYLLSASLNSSEINLKSLQFVNDSAIENFTISPLDMSTLSTAQIYLPSDARCFLLDTMSSNFLECKENLRDMPSIINTNEPVSLKEVKAVLTSQMVIFWLWSKSLQGWFEQCNVLHYSPELNIAIAAKSVEGFNFTALFTNSDCQHIENHSNLGTIVKIELMCHGLSINVFLIYEDENTYWYEHFDGHNTYKLSFPKFTLCSTGVFGMKINIPCEAGEILQSKYGQFLKNTTLHLDPERMENVVLESNI